MPDRRVLILSRLETLLGSVEGAPANAVYRNRGLLSTDMRPCMILLDGREDVSLSAEGKATRLRARTAPYVMILLPQIFAVLRAREPARAGEYAGELASYRNAILHAILHDEELSAIVGSNGDVAYRGHETDMETGSSMEGQLQMKFAFYYVLDPSSDLA